MSLGTNSVEKIWNSEHARNFRNQFLNGEQPVGCNYCWQEESVGKNSKRLKENSKYLERFKHRIDYAEKHGGKVDELPINLDLRLGNLCNLKCRSCSSMSSSAIEHEVEKYWDSDFSLIKEGGFTPRKNKQQWYATDIFDENIKTLIPYLEHVYITGGEPSLIKKVSEFLQYCLDADKTDIYIRLNTNLATWNEKFYSLLQNFNANLGPSIDVYGDKISYIRHPLKWATIEQNMQKLLAMSDNIEIFTNCTVTLMNVLYLDELFDWTANLSDRYNKPIAENVVFEIAHEPAFLHFNILPDSIKMLAEKRIRKMFNSKYITNQQINDLECIIHIMNDKQEISNTDNNRNKFKLYTKQLDNIRNESFINVFPELRELLDE